MESIKINEQQLRRIIRETLNNKEIKEAIVSHFTPYTEKIGKKILDPSSGTIRGRQKNVILHMLKHYVTQKNV